MKIAFYLDNLTFRGTTTAIKDYAKYNQSILNNESIIVFNSDLLTCDTDENFSKRFDLVEYFTENYETIQFKDHIELKEKLDEIDCEYIYFLKSGFFDDKFIPGLKNLIHCVFNFHQPHGFRYAYVSDWLSKTASNGECDFVPHMVSLPKNATEDYRKRLGISEYDFVVGRYGGFDQFDIQFVKETVAWIAANDSNVKFLFVNTRKFVNLPNVYFLDSILDDQEKTNFIKSCDIMLHGRSDGESFGLSMCEFLFHNKPVLSFGGGRDKNNVEMLKDYGLIYNNQYELIDKFFKLVYDPYIPKYSKIVKQFSPEIVMKKFNDVFLG